MEPNDPKMLELQAKIVRWVLWASFQVGIIFMFVFLKPMHTEPAQAVEGLTWLVAFAPVAISAVIRWILLPKVSNPNALLPMMIVGIAFAEATFLFTNFVFPIHRNEAFAAAVLGIFQFIPFYGSTPSQPREEEPSLRQ